MDTQALLDKVNEFNRIGLELAMDVLKQTLDKNKESEAKKVPFIVSQK